MTNLGETYDNVGGVFRKSNIINSEIQHPPPEIL